MASTATDRLGFEKPATGDDYNTWGTTLNNLYDMLDVAIAGNVSLTISGSNYTLTDTDYLAASEALNHGYIVGTSDATRSVIIPSEEKDFYVDNKSSYQILFKTSGGTGTIVLPGTRAYCYCDGTECYRIAVSGWGKASSTATTSGADVTIDTRVTGEEFTDAMFVFKAVSPSTNGDLVISLAGMTGSATMTGLFANNVTTYSGAIKMLNLRADAGVGHGYLTLDTNNVAASTLSSDLVAFKWALTGGVTTVTFDPSNNWDAGAIELWLR